MEYLNLEFLKQEYNDVWERRDKRLDGWPLLDSPIWTLLICISYLLLVKIGQRFMQNRPAFQLKQVMAFYNVAQVLANCWLFYEIGQGGWFHGYSFKCQPVDYSDDPMALRMVRVSYWYYVSKFTDLLDTFFFVLRKKDSHVSFLHLIHHGFVPISVWPGLRFFPGGHSTFFAFLNTLVHIVMYFYYMMSALGPSYRKFLWWKKYLTWFQIAQFVLATYHMAQPIFLDDCQYPKALACWVCGVEIMFLILFLNFYIQAYRSKCVGSKDSGAKKLFRKSIKNH